MLSAQTLEKLRRLRLHGMARAYEEQCQLPNIHQLSFEERMGLMVDREVNEREDKGLARRLKNARMKQPACLEDIDLTSPRGLTAAMVATLQQGHFLKQHQSVLIEGPAGVGKSYLACALGNLACRQGYTVYYQRVPRLFLELRQARGEGRYGRLLETLAKFQLLLLDDFGLSTPTEEQSRDLLEVLEDRHGRGSTVVTSQVPVSLWHQTLGEPTVADAILDRLVHGSMHITLSGESQRKRRS